MRSLGQRLVAGVRRASGRGRAGEAGEAWSSSSSSSSSTPTPTWNYAAFLRARSKDRRGLYKGTSQGCTTPNVSMAAVVNGIVWGATSQPLRHLEAAWLRHCGVRGVEHDAGSVEKVGVGGPVSRSLGLVDAPQMTRLLNGVGNVSRFLALSTIFTPLLVLSLPCMVLGYRREAWVRLLRVTLSLSGPAFIKWGQWAATRHDMFPRDVCRELQKLHSDAPSHDLAHTESEIEDSFGFRVEDLFDEFEGEPVASGSIGQIHRCALSDVGARLTGVDRGTVVAVKVRHPGVTRAIQRDFELMLAVIDGLGQLCKLGLFGRSFSDGIVMLKESVQQFAGPLREQVDLSREGQYLRMFAWNFRKEDKVNFPRPLFPLVSPSVLVETYEPGEHISRYVEGRGDRGDGHNTELARIGARAMLHMLIVDNLVHSDLHPGNILVDFKPRFGTSWLVDLGIMSDEQVNAVMTPSVVLLDAGMCTTLSKEDQVNMVGLFDSFSRLDGDDIAAWTLAFAGEQQTCADPEAFRRDVKASFDELKDRDLFRKGNTDNGAEALANVLENVRVHNVTMPGHICATVVTTLVLEGWSHQLDPAHSTLSEVRRIINMRKGRERARSVAAWLESVMLNEREILEGIDAHWEIKF